MCKPNPPTNPRTPLHNNCSPGSLSMITCWPKDCLCPRPSSLFFSGSADEQNHNSDEKRWIVGSKTIINGRRRAETGNHKAKRLGKQINKKRRVGPQAVRVMGTLRHAMRQVEHSPRAKRGPKPTWDKAHHRGQKMKVPHSQRECQDKEASTVWQRMNVPTRTMMSTHNHGSKDPGTRDCQGQDM